MNATITIRIDGDLDRLLSRVAETSGLTRSEVARQALRKQLEVALFERIRERIAPFAEARGILTDDDVFDAVS